MTISRLTLSIVIALLIAASLSAQNVVVQWNAIASTTIVTNAKESSVASGAWFAYVHLAVFDAVNAIDHRFQPYLYTTNPPAGANKDAAAVAAAYSVLVNYFPSQQTTLDADFDASIAAISDTPANISAGITVGEASAQALITARANDGLLANVPYTPPVGPGFWLPTPPAFGPPLTPWLGQMVPFTMSSAAQFFPDEGPDALDSQQWIDDYNQVMTLGAFNSTVRTPQQTEIGLFWTEHTGQQYARAFRNLATQEGLTTPDTARLMAMLWAGYADAGIGCWNAKFTFSFWRPVTAIQAGGGNPALVADPSWLPLANTPSHPEYPAAHGCLTGAVSTILAGYFGTPNLTFSVDSKVTGNTHMFTSTNDLMHEVEAARIYAGFHYHHSVIQGRVLGIKVGHQLVQQYFRPVH
ncbi:MAG: vanadium-dependent haloperoxidase [Candidatus Sulfotelmatobacter sp.]